MQYDSENIFAKIVRKEIPTKAVFEDDDVVAFHDVSPAMPSSFTAFSKVMIFKFSWPGTRSEPHPHSHPT